jgi:hypothetical protein
LLQLTPPLPVVRRRELPQGSDAQRFQPLAGLALC